MLALFKQNILSMSRDKGTLFFTAVFPVLMVFILGTMLSSLDNPDTVIDTMDIAYYVDTDDPQIQATTQEIVTQFDAIDQVNFIAAESPARASEQLAAGEISAFIVFSKPFGIEVFDGMDKTQNKAVHAIFTSVSRTYGCVATVMGAAMAGADKDAAPAAASAPGPEGAASGAGGPAAAPAPAAQAPAAPDLSALSDTSRVQEKTFGISRSMMDYYAITMIVMMFFMGSFMGGAMSFYQDRRNGTLRRVLVSPLRRSSVFLQYMASLIPMNLVQVLMVMVVSTTVFGAHYAATWQLNMLLFVMLLLTGLASSSVSLIIGIFVRVNPSLVLMPVMWPLLFICGTFSKEINIPNVSQWLPPSLIQNAAFDLTLFGKTTPSLWVMAVSAVLIVASALVGSVIINRKEVAS